jgi:hypothetical protein
MIYLSGQASRFFNLGIKLIIRINYNNYNIDEMEKKGIKIVDFSFDTS